MICKNCGFEIREDEKFCQNCGINISKSLFKPIQRRYLQGTNVDDKTDLQETSKEDKKPENSSRIALMIFLIIGMLFIGFAAGMFFFTNTGQLIPDVKIFQKQEEPPTVLPNNTSSSESKNTTEDKKTTACKRCGGDGWLTCLECHGPGHVSCSYCGGDGINDTGDPCGMCGGSGMITCPHCAGAGGFECWVCGGDGKVEI